MGTILPNTIVGTPTASPATLSVGPQDIIETLAVNGIKTLAVNGIKTLAVNGIKALEGYDMEILLVNGIETLIGN